LFLAAQQNSQPVINWFTVMPTQAIGGFALFLPIVRNEIPMIANLQQRDKFGQPALQPTNRP
jgi:hypothetical protein